MHDIDRTQTEMDPEADGLEVDSFEFQDESAFAGEVDGESPFTEVEEMELASALLEVTDEAELDQFIGKLFKRVARGVGRFVRSPVGRVLGGVIKNVAKTALPSLGKLAGGAGTLIPIPGVGTALGSMAGGALGSAAGRMFGAELEGMTPEDQEFEVARRVVRLAGSAGSRLRAPAAAATTGQTAVRMAKQMAADAIRTHAPGFFAAMTGGQQAAPAEASGRGTGGRWVRRGRTIVLFGA